MCGSGFSTASRSCGLVEVSPQESSHWTLRGIPFGVKDIYETRGWLPNLDLHLRRPQGQLTPRWLRGFEI